MISFHSLDDCNTIPNKTADIIQQECAPQYFHITKNVQLINIMEQIAAENGQGFLKQIINPLNPWSLTLSRMQLCFEKCEFQHLGARCDSIYKVHHRMYTQ